MEVEKEVSKVMADLHSGSRNSLYNSLIILRTTLIKSKAALNLLVQNDAVKLLVQLLEDHRRHVNRTKTIDIVMSILANMCIEEDIREKVVNCDGVSVIARVTMSSEQESIQNRGMRALANLAFDVGNCEKIFELEVPAFVAKRLMETEDVDCRSTYCRALQLFGQSGKHVKRLVEDTQAIQALAALLKLDNRKLALKSLRILSELSALRCCPSFTGQMLAANVLEELVSLADDEDSSPASCSLSIILRLCEQEIMRPALGSAGVVSLLVKLLKSDRSFVNKISALNALCLCTKEAVNRNKIQDAGGLELFVSALKGDRPNHLSEGQFSILYDRIISSLINFLYNDDCLGKLLELGLVRILTEHLKRVCSFISVDEDWRQEANALVRTFETDESLHADRPVLKDRGHESGNFDGRSSQEKKRGGHSQTNSASHSNSAFLGVLEEQDSEIENESQPLESQVNEVNQMRRSTGQEVDLIDDSDMIASSDERMVGVEYEVSENAGTSDSMELPVPPTTQSRHTFSINSPTYQAESSWRLEDYTSGVTCKSFSQEQETYRMSPYNSSLYSPNAGVVQAPYSPLSAGSSYYSPSQSSPPHSVPLTPQQFLSPSSQASGSYRDSPAWSQSTVENRNSPVFSDRHFNSQETANLSPPSLMYQNHFSPLSSDFPGSLVLPFGDGHSQSPIPGSQTSLQSQDIFVPYTERPLDSLATGGASEEIDQLLTASREASSSRLRFTVVPVSHHTESSDNIYSASEDDDDDDMCSDTELKSSSQESRDDNRKREINDRVCQVDDFLSANNSGHSLSGTRGKAPDIPSSSQGRPAAKDPSDCGNSKRRKLNNNLSVSENLHEICGVTESENNGDNVFKAKRLSSVGFMPHTSPDDVEEQSQAFLDDTVTNSSAVLNSNLDPNTAFSSTQIDEICLEKIQRPSSTTPFVMRVSDNSKGRSLQRMSSYPGKGKWPIKNSSFRRHLSAAVSHTVKRCLSPVASTLTVSRCGASPLISDSPYRSPYPEPSQNSLVSSESLRANTENCVTARADASASSASQEISPGASSNIPAIKGIGCSGKTDAGQNSRSKENTSDDRLKKILRTTEHNILILLARVSLKTNPMHLIAESSIISCLPGYIGTAPNPFRRSCRILHRLCTNPLCFKKLILMQMPAILVKSLVLERDGSFPVDFCNGKDVGAVGDLCSSQGSDLSSSQTSEFGRKMDFEFGGDAYSRMTSKKQSSLASIFRSGPSLSVDSETARDGLNGSDDIYEAGSSRVETRVKIGLELLHTMGAVAMSSFGEGEIQHVLTRHSVQDKLACIVSMLHLRVGWGHFTCRQFFAKYSLWEKVLPCLFVPEAPVVREAIVAAMSLNVHLDNPPKLTQKIPKLPACLDLVKDDLTPDRGAETSGKPYNECPYATMRSKSSLSVRKAEENEMLNAKSLKETSKKLSYGYSGVLDGRCNENFVITASHTSKTATSCSYQNMLDKHDVCFLIQEENDICKFGAHRKTLMQKSDIFAAMFSGSYAESMLSEISFTDVDKDTFEFIIHYLHGCFSGCPVIDRLDVEGIKDKIIVTDISSKEPDSTMQPKDQMLHDKDVGFGLLLADSQNCGCESEQEATKHSSLSPVAKQEDKDGEDSKMLRASRKLTFDKPPMDGGGEDSDVVSVHLNELDLEPPEESSGLTQKSLDTIINKCVNLLALADRFLLKNLMIYLASFLSHSCLCPDTIEVIFSLACFYKLDSLAFDCIRETLMSSLPCSDAAAIYRDLADDGYREQVHAALTNLLNSEQSD